MATQNVVDIVLRAVDNASRTINHVRGSLGGVQRAYERAVGPSRAFATAVAAGGTAALGAAGYMVRLAGQLEQTEIAFTTMLGSAEGARAFLDDLADTAARTPFNLTGLQNASRLLLAFGFEAQDAIPIVTTLGDAVSALGGGDAELQGVIRAIGQIQAKGKVSAEELLQLAERGIPAYEILGEQLGLTGEQVANIGTLGIDAATGINALLAGLGERFAGAMDAQSKTLLGMLSNVQDEATRVAQLVGDEIVEIFNLKPALDTAIQTLGTLRTRIEDVGLKEVLRGIADEAIIAAGALTGAMLPAIINLATMIGRATLRLAPWIAAGAIAADVARRMGTEFEDVLPVLQRIALGFSGIVDVTIAVGGAVAQLVTDGVEAVRVYMRSTDQFMALLANIGDAIAAGAGPRQLARLWSDGFDSINRDVEAGLNDMLNNSTDAWLEIGDRLDAGVASVGQAITGTNEEVAASTRNLTDVLGGVAESVADVTNQLTSPLDTTGLLDVATDLDGVTTSANDAAAAVTGLRNAWGLPDAAVRGGNVGEADRIRQDTEAAMDQAGYRPVVTPDVSVNIKWRDQRDAAIFDALFAAGRLGETTDNLQRVSVAFTARELQDQAIMAALAGAGGVTAPSIPIALNWRERQDAAIMDALFGSGRLGGTTDNLVSLTTVFTPRELQDQAVMDALAGEGGVTDQLMRLPVALDWRERQDQAIFDALFGGGRLGGTTDSLLRVSTVFTARELQDQAIMDALFAGTGGVTIPLDFMAPDTGGGPTGGGEVEEANGVVDVLLSSLQGLANQVPAVGAAIQGFMTGGPWGALIAGVSSLLGESDAFRGIMEQLGKVLEPIVGVFTTLLDALAPLVSVAFALIEVALAPLVAIIENVVAPVFMMVARAIGGIWNAIAGAINATIGALFGFQLPTIDLAQRYRPTEPDDGRDPTRDTDTATPGRPDVNFGSTSQGVQLAVATPLVQAADTMILAAEMMVDAASQSRLASPISSFGRHVDTFGQWVDLLTTRGIPVTVNVPSGRSVDRAAALGSA